MLQIDLFKEYVTTWMQYILFYGYYYQNTYLTLLFEKEFSKQDLLEAQHLPVLTHNIKKNKSFNQQLDGK